MSRFGIDTRSALGVTVTELRGLARRIGRDHVLAAALWESGVHEARILASMVDDPSNVTEAQMETWISDVSSWDLCDQLCGNLFERTPFAFDKAHAWSRREEEFVKRAGFALMAYSAVHRKDLPDAQFEVFLPAIRAQATDDRNYVKKAVSWALRQIGKRSRGLNRKAIATARQIERLDSRAARWIASDVRRELESAPVQDRLRRT
jgi:3-methyladenine DNA glycosylase AlkD